MITLEELQKSTTTKNNLLTGQTVTHEMQNTYLYGRVARGKRHREHINKTLWAGENKLKLFGLQEKLHFWRKN